MSTLAINARIDYASPKCTVLEYPATELAATDYHAFNVAVCEKPSADPAIAALDFRIETDRPGPQTPR